MDEKTSQIHPYTPTATWSAIIINIYYVCMHTSEENGSTNEAIVLQ